jgi:two-component system, NarL family, response regulator LiaR
VKRIVLLYGIALAILIGILKFLEYRYIIRDLSMEFYLGIVAILFAALGIWVGLRITGKKIITVPISDFVFDQHRLERLGISKREYEVLEHMAKGLSNQEIADVLFVSINTIKTHSSSLFVKLDAKRRTQAIQKAKELLLIP